MLLLKLLFHLLCGSSSDGNKDSKIDDFLDDCDFLDGEGIYK